MTKDEANRVAQAMQALNGFATTSNMLNTNASWHATWQQLYAQVIREVAAMVVAEDKAPGQDPRKPADTKPDKAKK